MTEAEKGRWKRLKRSFTQIGPVRLLGTILLIAAGLYIARYNAQIPLSSDAERALYDLRFYSKARVVQEPDDRIVLVVYNDDTLRQLGKRSPLDRSMLARALRALDAMHPRAIGIDILIDQPQAEDAELIETFRQLRTPTYLAYASHAANPDQMDDWQQQYLEGFLRRSSFGPLRPASIKLEPDLQDGVIRRWTRPDPGLPPLLANAMTSAHPEFRGHTGAIQFTVPADREVRRFPKISIEEIADLESLPPEARDIVLAEFARRIEGRYVLIGGDIHDQDDFETPMTRFNLGWTKGVEVHAQLLAQQLDGRMPRPIPRWFLWFAAAVFVTLGALTGAFELRGWRLILAAGVQLVLLVWMPFQIQAMNFDTVDLPAVGGVLGWVMAVAGAGAAARAVGSEERRFAQSALGKYLPRDVAREIMRDPDRLALTGEKTKIFALFTDLEGFTKLSHAITPEQLSPLLNRYLDLMSAIVLKHGGTLDKFVGDALVTFWGAPIARPDDADRAIRAGREMFEAGEEFRRSAGDDIPPIGVTRVGLHHGEAIVGNFGGEGRIQYTALGDAMNCAARLESANKALKTTMLVSSPVRRESSLDIFRPMGRIVVSGRGTPIEVWEPVPDMDSGGRDRLNQAWLAFDGGDVSALGRLEEIAAAHPEDAALQYFIYRIREVGPGGHFVLGSK
jgi:adenylate cyclase